MPAAVDANPAYAVDADQAYHAYKTRKRFSNLDGLRFFCILMVLWHHTPKPDFDFAIFQRGFLGVDFFFVLSGFLITTLLLREQERKGFFSLKNFYLRRIIRIIPVYYFVITIVCIYYILIKGRSDLSELVPYYYLFLSNFLIDEIPTLAPTWSLSVEEQFYIIWPLLLLLVPGRLILWVGLLLIVMNVAGIMGFFGLEPIFWGPLKIALPNATYAPLIIGALLAYLLNQSRGFAFLSKILGGRWTLIALTVVLIFVIETMPPDLRGLPNLLIHLVMASILANLVIRQDVIGSAILQNGIVARIGVVSYGIYLYHLLVLDVVGRGLSAFGANSNTLTFLTYSIGSYIIAELSFRTLETFFQRFRPKN